MPTGIEQDTSKVVTTIIQNETTMGSYIFHISLFGDVWCVSCASAGRFRSLQHLGCVVLEEGRDVSLVGV